MRKQVAFVKRQDRICDICDSRHFFLTRLKNCGIIISTFYFQQRTLL